MNTPASARQPFLWGVSTSAYQSEGGYNGPGQPQTNWGPPESLGTVAKTGKAAEFWTRYAEDFTRCRDLGINAFRLGFEWSRIQPVVVQGRTSPPAFDLAALDRYATMAAECRRSGLEPVVTLHHFVHPAWLGADAWLEESTVDLFVEYALETLRRVNGSLVEKYHLPPIHYLITINEPNTLAISTYIARQFPTRTFGGVGKAIRATANLLAAHVRAFHAIHELYAKSGWARPAISTNNFCTDLYWTDKVLLDLLSLRENSVAPAAVSGFIHDKAHAFEQAYARAGIRRKTDLPSRVGEAFRKVFFHRGFRQFRAQAFERLFRELEAAPTASALDYLALDYYDPFTAHLLRMPTFSDLEFRDRSMRSHVMNSITSKWWDWHVLPAGMGFFCHYYSKDFGDRPVLIAENGMALRRRWNNHHALRRDRSTRSEYLALHASEAARLAKAGVPVFGYLHWALFDNYEWGTYTPRFGLFSIDFTQGTDRLVEDHLGDRPSETYARIIRETATTT